MGDQRKIHDVEGWHVLAVVLGPVLAAVAVVLTLLLVTAADAAPVADRPTRVNTYETPCEYRERTARGIPPLSVDRSRGLMAYVDRHLHGTTPDAELADYWAALRRCDRDEPVPDWDFDRMILVNVEYI